MKSIPACLLTLLIFSPCVSFAQDWPKDLCPTNEAACLTINENTKPPPPKNLTSGRVVFAFGTDGCLASAPVWYNAQDNAIKSNPGIETGGAMNKRCEYHDQLDKAYITYNEIVAKDNPSYKARIFGLYAVKDESTLPFGSHKHEWEHAIIWMKDNVPQFVSTTEHDGVNTKKAEEATHLKDNPSAFTVKYIVKKTTHYLDFAKGDKHHNATNNDPTPDHTWFASSDAQLVDYSQATDAFKSIIDKRQNWGKAVPRVNDKNFLNKHKPKDWKNVSFD